MRNYFTIFLYSYEREPATQEHSFQKMNQSTHARAHVHTHTHTHTHTHIYIYIYIYIYWPLKWHNYIKSNIHHLPKWITHIDHRSMSSHRCHGRYTKTTRITAPGRGGGKPTTAALGSCSTKLGDRSWGNITMTIVWRESEQIPLAQVSLGRGRRSTERACLIRDSLDVAAFVRDRKPRPPHRLAIRRPPEAGH